LKAAEDAPARAVSSPVAFEAMYAAAWPRLCRYTWVLVRHHEDSEDVAAETIRRAYSACVAGHGPVGDPLPWLFLIARRIVIDRTRRPVLAWLPLSRAGDQPAPIDSPSGAEAAAWFDQLRECMSARQHEAVVLRYLFDFSDAQIGRIMGLSSAAVRTQVSRGVAALRKRPEVLDL